VQTGEMDSSVGDELAADLAKVISIFLDVSEKRIDT